MALDAYESSIDHNLYPASLRGTNAVQRGFTAVDDPVVLPSVLVTNGDVWYQVAANVTPPPPTGMAAIIANAGTLAGTSFTDVTLSAGIIVTGKASLTTVGLTVTGSGTKADPYLVQNTNLNLGNGIIDMRGGGYYKFYNCKVHTSFFGTSDTAVFKCTNTGWPSAGDPAQLIVDKCEVYCDIPSYYVDGFIGHSFTLTRTEVYHTQDGVGSQVATSGGAIVSDRGDIAVDSCYIWGRVYFEGKYNPVGGSIHTSLSNDLNSIRNASGNPEKPDGSHADAIQLQGGKGSRITNNVLDSSYDMTRDSNGSTTWVRKGTAWALTDPAGNGQSPWGCNYGNSSIQINQNQAPANGFVASVDDVFIDGNYMLGGKYSQVNWSSVGYGANGSFVNQVYTNNHHVLPPSGYQAGAPLLLGALTSDAPGYPINIGSAVPLDTVTIGGNVMDANGSPLPWRHDSSTIAQFG